MDYFDKIIKIQDLMINENNKEQKLLNIIKSLIEIEHERYIKNTKCEDRGGLKNVRNSCYMDSVLLPLLSDPPKFIRENILAKPIFDDTKKENIRRELINIYSQIKKGKFGEYCTNLRGAINNIDTIKTLDINLEYLIKRLLNYGSSSMEDSGEFIKDFLEYLNLDYESPYGISRYYPNKTNPELLITEDINISTNLKLFAIIVFSSSHYMSYYLCEYQNKDMWFFYNDLGPSINIIGNLNDVENNIIKKNLQKKVLLYKKI
jgi:ubiquitin C-terminal hydrolase